MTTTARCGDRRHRHRADLGDEPWRSARFHTRDEIEQLTPRHAVATRWVLDTLMLQPQHRQGIDHIRQ
jgi:hypothetical protein